MRFDNRGFSLVELMIATMILPIVLSAGYLVFETLSNNYSTIQAQSEVSANVQDALDTIVRELRQGQPLEVGGGVVNIAEPRQCVFYSDIDHDHIPEEITYYADGTDLFRRVSESRTVVYPYDFVDDPARRVANLSNVNASIFEYYGVNQPYTPLINPGGAQVSAVAIHLSGARPSTTGLVSVDFSTKVKLRAMFAAF